MAVPYVFSPLPNGSTIPLSHLDADFAYLAGEIQNLDIRLPLRVLSNIAALRLLAVTPDYNVSVNGYYTSGDDGGGLFYPVYGSLPGTYIDNGGTVIVPTGGDGSSAWLRNNTSPSLVVNGPVTPEMFGAKGDGVTNDTAAIQAMFTAARNIVFPGPTKLYIVSSSGINVPSIVMQGNTTVTGSLARIQQTTNSAPIFQAVSKNYISISGIHFIGKGSDFVVSDSLFAVGINTEQCYYVEVFNNRFENFAYTSWRSTQDNKTFFHENLVLQYTPSPDDGVPYGVLFQLGFYATISNNQFYSGGQGIRVEKNAFTTITGNIIQGVVGQHGMYIGSNCSFLSIAGNTVSNCYYIGIKVQSSDLVEVPANGPIYSVSITGNSINSTGSHGIAVNNALDGRAAINQLRSVSISGNAVYTAGGSFIAAQDSSFISITGNTGEVSGDSGISLVYCRHFNLSDNSIGVIDRDGIFIQGCDIGNVKNNTIRNPAIIVDAANNNGISVRAGLENNGVTIRPSAYVNVSGNEIYSTTANGVYGIFLESGITQSTISVYDNSTIGFQYGARFVNATDPLIIYKDNYFTGSSLATFNDPALVSVASASTISLTTSQDVFFVTGTNNITTITANGHSNHIVTLIFTGALTVIRGSNLILNQSSGNFVTNGADTLTLCSDGVNWYEISRSLN